MTRAGAVGLASLAALAGCAAPPPDDVPAPRVLIASSTYSRGDPEAAAERLRSLTRAIQRLRRETGTGWVGRQDDATGYLAELSGGGFSGQTDDPLRELLDRHGTDLFGVRGDAVTLREREDDEGGGSFLRAGQTVRGVPVVDGELTATLTAGSRLLAVRGRVFPGLAVETTPAIPAREARRRATARTGGAADAATLVVLPLGSRPDATWDAALAWEVTVLGPERGAVQAGAATVYVDAAEGAVLVVRPAAAELAASSVGAARGAAAGQAAGDGASVAVTGRGPLGEALEGSGTRRPDGSVALVDATVPSFDPATGEGGIQTHDMRGLSESDPPGPIATFAGPEIADPEALGAHVFARYVFDYYLEEHGRSSWDGRGATMRSSVHVGDPDYCNAYFQVDKMLYGDACVVNGQRLNATFIDVDVTAHEITHGVTRSTADLLYSGPSGALNEAFSDYFGNVIGDRYAGRDSDTLGEAMCSGITSPTPLCSPTPDGATGVRYLPNGNTLADFANLLDPTPALKAFVRLDQDNGGVHINSSIWNHALWSIRRRLAQIDDRPMVESQLAAQLDRAVYAALTRHLTPTSGFLDARRAVETAAVDLGLDPVVLRVAKEVFDRARICEGCTPAPPSPGLAVAASSAAEKGASVAGERVAWLNLATGNETVGSAAIEGDGSQPSSVSGQSAVTSVAFAGPDALVVTDASRQTASVLRLDLATGETEVLDSDVGTGGAILGVAGSDEGAAWVDFTGGTIGFVDASGAVTTAQYPSDQAGQPLSIGTGGGTVAIGAAGGAAVAWRVGSAPSTVRIPGEGLAAGAFGDRVVILATADDPYASTAVAIDVASGQSTVLSERAAPLGVAVSERYAVWSQSVGALPGPIGAGIPFRDTDLYLHSFATGTTYSAIPGRRGQQGFPSLSGDRLAWQDAINGGDDIFTGVLPKEL